MVTFSWFGRIEKLSRYMMTISIQGRITGSTLLLWCGFRHLKITAHHHCHDGQLTSATIKETVPIMRHINRKSHPISWFEQPQQKTDVTSVFHVCLNSGCPDQGIGRPVLFTNLDWRSYSMCIFSPFFGGCQNQEIGQTFLFRVHKIWTCSYFGEDSVTKKSLKRPKITEKAKNHWKITEKSLKRLL
jgi:hypothetical protein